TQPLRKAIKKNVERYHLAGQDLEIESPQYVSIQIELQICVDPDYFRADVKEALDEVLSNRLLPNGQKGIFFPDSFGFGQTVYLSPVYAAARKVPGVQAVTASIFQPQGINSPVYLQTGEIKLGSFQVARLENDRNFPDHGQLTLVMEGGK
ncbi:MAG TPA: putative baseplate assembly protein, partial [Candidatus Angelobacter sp.]|nr:putative baseplate assembly protein [Candidatus Angelobacter sp.]